MGDGDYRHYNINDFTLLEVVRPSSCGAHEPGICLLPLIDDGMSSCLWLAKSESDPGCVVINGAEIGEVVDSIERNALLISA